MTEWVLSGRDYVRYNIGIVKLGLVTHPYKQVIQDFPEMTELQKEFDNLTKTSGDEKIQMIVRIGRADPSYKSWRKNVDYYIIKL
jgi:hypothetical protein